ncbi:beta-galactosidase [Aureimonas sp. AU4]|uniref:beta-galactosidase n=1 Tax=Aureimonas sp. AU4 TaxID=1638163 RepID=UPI000782C5E2|nr:beta-galactosidase [Aureimonas sp. AU4]
MDSRPWYRRTLRWGQTNLVEIDPERYDAEWWRDHWRRTRVQGVIVNAGGIVAYYPSAVPHHHHAERLGTRDLYGEIVRAAREEGLAVIARMDSNRVAADLFEAHPDWICRDAAGEPYRQGDKYVTCINSGYYRDHLPAVMREIVERSSPDGFADNSWAGLPRRHICHCANCRDGFSNETGHALPERHDPVSETYRAWIAWNYRCRTRLWEHNNRVTTEAGGEHCLWNGMISGDVLNNGARFIDLRAILQRSHIVMLDHQRRSAVDGFDQNTEAGRRLHELAGWDILIPESTPQYQLGQPAFRLSSMPEAEVRLWSSAGFAGGIQPWWHHIGALHEDRRQYQTAESIFRWHAENERYLVDRQPVADVGVVWSQENHDLHGGNEAEERTLDPYRGATEALNRAGLAWMPVHAEDIGAAQGRFRVLILPNIGVLSDEQVVAVERFAAGGGSVIATGETSLRTGDGAPRDDFALGSLFGIRRHGTASRGGTGPISQSIEDSERHTYLRLMPELRAGVDGPHDATAPTLAGHRHPVLDGFELTDTLPFGGLLCGVEVREGAQVLATFVPDFPIFPPETSWMRQPRTDLPAVTAREAGASRLVWFFADIDRCLARDGAPDHARLLANAVRWCLRGEASVELEGAQGFIIPSLFRQDDRWILHLNNRLVTEKVPGRQSELVAIGPITVALHGLPAARTDAAHLLVAGLRIEMRNQDGRFLLEVPTIHDHEVVVID